jgi:hypothetical protein
LTVLAVVPAWAQDTQGPMTEAEVESLRDSAFVPMERIRAFERILDDRQKEIERLLKRGQYPGSGQDLHDAIDQFSAIADEMNDNLDDFASKHRDLRKVLPKLVLATERWATTLRSAGENDEYKVVRKIALDTVADMKAIAEELESSQEAYFKEHPDAAKSEKARNNDPHAPTAETPPR